MEHIAVRGVVQAGELAQQVVVNARSVDKCRIRVIDALEVGLINHLVRAPIGRFIGVGRGIVVGSHAIERNRTRALDSQLPTGINGDVIAAHARRVEFQRATVAAVIAGRGSSTVTQVDARPLGQGQLALARAEDHDGAVRRIDDLAVAVHPKLAAMGIEHRRAVQAQALLGGQVYAAHALAAGIHQAGHAQAAIVDRDVDAVGLDVIADGQVALLELEAACTVDLALVEALVERCELVAERTAAAQALGLDLHRTREVWHPRATGIVVTAAAGDDLACQVDDPRSAVHRHRAQLARLVVLRRQVDGRSGGLLHIAGTALQQNLAACAVFGQVIEGNGPAGHINRGGIGQHHVAPRAQSDLAAGQYHGSGQAKAIALQ